MNKYTNQEPTRFCGQEPSYGYHTTIYETGDFKTARFSVEIKEYKDQVVIQIKFFGITPNGSAGPHGFQLDVQKAGDWVNKVEQIVEKALGRDFSDFPNPAQYNRSISISNGEENVRTWVADCGSAQSFAEKCFQLND